MATSRRPHTRELIAAGASVRALACSAARAGWSVHAADLFGDADLRAAAVSMVAAGSCGGLAYPQSLVAAVAGLPSAVPWCYTGAVENHPDVIAAIAAERPLLGTTAAGARAVRDHALLAEVVRAAEVGYPTTFNTPADVPRDGTFLVKPRASAAGRGIAVWDRTAVDRSVGAHVWQQRVPGAPWAAAYVISRTGHCRLWGLSRQLVGVPWCHARPFAYCGSIDVPLEVMPRVMQEPLARLGRAIAAAFAPQGLTGLVGIDLIVDASSSIHVIEVNPRPTASMELVERRTGESLAATHLAACGGETQPPRSCRPQPAIWAKAVLFASREIRVEHDPTASFRHACKPAHAAEQAWPLVADIPCPGTVIPAGAPLLTVFAAADADAPVLDRLRRRAAMIDSAMSAGEPARL